MPSISGPSITSSGRVGACRASSVSSSMKSTMPWTSACSSRFSTGASRQERSTSRCVASPLTVSANATRRSVASGRRSKMHVLDALEQVGRDVLVDDELAGVDDAHVEAGVDRVVEERGVHRLAHDVVAAEREREVRDAAARARARAALLDQRQRLDERLREVVVLLDPGRDREHVRVEDDVLGREADLVRRAGRRRARRSRPSARPSPPGPARRTPSRRRRRRSARIRRACSRNASSPSLRLIELTTPLPCTQLEARPRARDQRELSTMIGRRATSGSVAIRLRNVVIACSPSSRSASMFTSSRFAPPRTCSSATSTAPWQSSASISARKRAEPVTFVRSPIITKPVSGPISNGSRPLKRVPAALRRDGAAAGRATAAAIAAMCSGVVPQQPPTTLTRPSSANSRRKRARVVRLLVVAAERVRQAGVRIAARVRVARRGRAPPGTAASRSRRASS